MSFSFTMARPDLERAIQTSALTGDSETIQLRFSAGGLDFVREKKSVVCVAHCPVQWHSEQPELAYTLSTDRKYFGRLLLELVHADRLDVRANVQTSTPNDARSTMLWSVKADPRQPSFFRYNIDPAEADPNAEEPERPSLPQASPPPDWNIELDWPFAILSQSTPTDPILIDAESSSSINPHPLASALRLISTAISGHKNARSCHIEPGRVFCGVPACARMVEDPQLIGPTYDLDADHLGDIAHVLARLSRDTATIALDDLTITYADERTLLRVEKSTKPNANWPTSFEPATTATLASKELVQAIQRITSQCEGKRPFVRWTVSCSDADRLGFQTMVRSGPATLKFSGTSNAGDAESLDRDELSVQVEANLLPRLVPLPRSKDVKISFLSTMMHSFQNEHDVSVQTLVFVQRAASINSPPS